MSSNQDDFINLENFKKKTQIKEDPDFSTCEIINKETSCKYIANIFKKDIKEFTKEKLAEFSNDFSFISKFNHPSIMKYKGYSPHDFKKNAHPVVITDMPKSETLYQVIESRSNVIN